MPAEELLATLLIPYILQVAVALYKSGVVSAAIMAPLMEVGRPFGGKLSDFFLPSKTQGGFPGRIVTSSIVDETGLFSFLASVDVTTGGPHPDRPGSVRVLWDHGLAIMSFCNLAVIFAEEQAAWAEITGHPHLRHIEDNPNQLPHPETLANSILAALGSIGPLRNEAAHLQRKWLKYRGASDRVVEQFCRAVFNT